MSKKMFAVCATVTYTVTASDEDAAYDNARAELDKAVSNLSDGGGDVGEVEELRDGRE